MRGYFRHKKRAPPDALALWLARSVSLVTCRAPIWHPGTKLRMKKQRRGAGGDATPPADAPTAAVHADPRFAAVHSNPRFARFPKARLATARRRLLRLALTRCGPQAKSKVEIDQRFSGVFSDPKFKRSTVVDKRGRATGAKCVAASTAAACCKRSRTCSFAQGAHRRLATLLPPSR